MPEETAPGWLLSGSFRLRYSPLQNLQQSPDLSQRPLAVIRLANEPYQGGGDSIVLHAASIVYKGGPRQGKYLTDMA